MLSKTGVHHYGGSELLLSLDVVHLLCCCILTLVKCNQPRHDMGRAFLQTTWSWARRAASSIASACWPSPIQVRAPAC